ncbi:MAG: hypothetical protein C0597_11635 [Marinilabiliales bacterium]|nr:MAG: hypothetical protein C0597_11635 [Marinilabiliales bacterium]
MMEREDQNPFVFTGEVVEILSDQSSVRVCVKYKPGIIMMEIPTNDNYELGDEILISGKLNCEKIENIDYLSTNNKSELL